MRCQNTFKIIVATGLNNEIGAHGDLLWHLPKDMKWFKQNTTGADVIMGRKTYESFPAKYRPLPNRTNIIITHQKDYAVPDGVFVFHSIKDALVHADSYTDTEKYIIGGGAIYKECLPLCNEIALTKVHATFPKADTFFPHIQMDEWREVWAEHHTKDEKHAYDFSFIRLVRQ